MQFNKFTYLMRIFFLSLLLIVIGLSGCSTKKKKGETSKLSKFYHNMTSKYNGYFNANELYVEALVSLRAANVDNYNEIIEVMDYVSVNNPKMVAPEMERAIEKLVTVATLHEKGDYVDDCYVLMAKAQFLKQDYLTCTETLEYFREEFNPQNPRGRAFQKKKLDRKAKAKIKEKERKEKQKEKEDAKKLLAKQKETEKREKERQREAEKKQREKDRKVAANARKKGGTTARKRVPLNQKGKEDELAQTTNAANADSTQQQPNISKPATTAPAPPAVENVAEEVVQVRKTLVNDNTSYYEGLVWLAKSYVRTGKYANADFLLNDLERLAGLRKEARIELAPTRAEYYIKTGRYQDAIPYLEEAILSAPSGNLKGRYSFIIGQILMMDAQYKSALPYFKYAKSKSSDFKLRFMAELSMVKSGILSGGRSRSEMAGQLEKMLKERKYEEYQDHIYYAMAEIELSGGDKNKGIEYLKKSLSSDGKDASLKSEAYYVIAGVSYDNMDYINAKLYFDSTLTVMPKSDLRYMRAKKMVDNLSEIATHMQTVLLQDSLLKLGELPKEELEKRAKKILAEEIAAGKKNAPAQGKPGAATPPGGAAINLSSNFYAYNPVQIQKGIQDFKKTWGEIRLEDNWRTSASRAAMAALDNSSPDKPKDEYSDVNLTDADFKRIMGNVPVTLAQKDRSYGLIKKALLQLGILFRNNVENYEKSIEALTSLNERFPFHEDEAESFYYLYLSHKDLGNTEKAEYYKRELVKKYPDSKFAKILTDPEYVKRLLAENKSLDQYYDITYGLYEKGYYAEAQKRVQESFNLYGVTNKLAPKFNLLNAFCLGFLDSDEAYQNGLREVVVKHPNTPEATKASEILRFLTGDISAMNVVSSDEDVDKFQAEDDKRHYVAVVLFSYEDEVLQKAKISVSEYNKSYHKQDRLQLADVILSKEEQTQIILVRTFDNKAKSMDYYNGVLKNREAFISATIANYDVFPITQKNYREMLKQRTHNNYRVWFNKENGSN